MDAKEISIIVPVYNSEPYFRNCLDSILAQTFKDWECILIDDGSHDGSDAICDEYAHRDSRFRVLHKKNMGVSSARNSGLDVCRGNYIAFIDSDDYVSQDFLERMRNVIIESAADVVQCGLVERYTNFSRNRPFVKDKLILDTKQVAYQLMRNTIVPSYLCNKLFRREVVDTHFPVEMVYEDVYSLSDWVGNIKKMVLIPDLLYNYRQRKGSIVNTISTENMLDMIKAFRYRADRIREINKDAVSKDMLDRMICNGLISAARNLARFVNDHEQRVEKISQISGIAKDYPNFSFRTLGLKRWWRGYLLRADPSLFALHIRFFYMFSFRNRKKDNHKFE